MKPTQRIALIGPEGDTLPAANSLGPASDDAIDALLACADDFMLGDIAYVEVGEVERACRKCGCTELRACPGGCYWVEEDLCSRCAGEAA